MAHSKGSLFLRTYKKTVVKTTNTWISSKLCLAYARFDSQFSNLVLACCRIRGKKKPVKSVFSLLKKPNTQALLNRKWQLQNFGGWVVQHPHQVHDNSLSLFLLTSFAPTPVPLHSWAELIIFEIHRWWWFCSNRRFLHICWESLSLEKTCEGTHPNSNPIATAATTKCITWASQRLWNNLRFQVCLEDFMCVCVCVCVVIVVVMWWWLTHSVKEILLLLFPSFKQQRCR